MILPVRDTWASTAEVFPSDTEAAAIAGKAGDIGERVLRPFHRPVQIVHGAAMAGTESGGDTAAEVDRLVSFNKFSPEAATYIQAEQPMPDGSGMTHIDTQHDLERYNAVASGAGAKARATPFRTVSPGIPTTDFRQVGSGAAARRRDRCRRSPGVGRGPMRAATPA